jgi:carboxylesterase type B
MGKSSLTVYKNLDSTHSPRTPITSFSIYFRTKKPLSTNVNCLSPRAPAFDASSFEQNVLIQAVIDETPSPRMSGTECLNLNITVPYSIETETERKFPVMVFIHGGGFIMGSNSAPYFDPSRLVALSVQLGTPVIVVSIK